MLLEISKWGMEMFARVLHIEIIKRKGREKCPPLPYSFSSYEMILLGKGGEAIEG